MISLFFVGIVEKSLTSFAGGGVCCLYMKKLLISTSIFATACAMADTFTLNGYDVIAGHRTWSDSSVWDKTGTGENTYPNSEYDEVYLDTKKEKLVAGNQNSDLIVDGNYTVKSLMIDLVGDGNAHYRLNFNSNKSLTVKKDLTIMPALKYFMFQLQGNSSNSLTVGGNLNLKNDNFKELKSGWVQIALGASTETFGSIEVNGDVNVTRYDENSTFKVQLNTTSFVVDGAVNLCQNVLYNILRSNKNTATTQSYGALNGGGIIELGNSNKSFQVELSLGSDTVDDGLWSGKFTKGEAGLTNADSSINITKVGSNTQEFKISSATFATNFTDAEQYAINNLKVTAGTFVYGAGEGVLSGVLRNIAGTFKVGGVAAAEEGVMDVGTVNFASGEWVGGTIALDVDMSTEINDALNFNGTFNAASAKSDETASSRVLYIDFNSELMAELIESEGSYTVENLISYDSTNLTADDFVIKGVEGYDYEAVIGENGLGVIITAAVPEPADIAILIGAVALGFVAYRRRK